MDSKIDTIQTTVLNKINPYLQNITTLQTQLNNLQIPTHDYSSEFNKLNANFVSLDKKTDDITLNNKSYLSDLTTKFTNLYNEIDKKLELFSSYTRSHDKRFLVDEENYVKSNSEFILELKPDLQNGKLLINDLELGELLNNIDIHNNKFYFNVISSDTINSDDDKNSDIEINSVSVEPGNYKIKELLDLLNKKLLKFDLHFEVKSNNCISIKMKKSSTYISFNIYNLDNCILSTLGYKLKKYENAIIYNSEIKYDLVSPNIYYIYLIDNDNELKLLGKYVVKSRKIYMDCYEYKELQKLRFKIKLANNCELKLSNINNLELSIQYIEYENINLTKDSYAFTN